MSVVDVKSIYRSVPINLEHSRFQDLRRTVDGEEKFFYDRRVCFGLKCGPFYFNHKSEFNFNEVSKRVNYFDDFIVYLDPTRNACKLKLISLNFCVL